MKIKKLVTVSGVTYVVGGVYPASAPATVTKITKKGDRYEVFSNRGGSTVMRNQDVRSYE